VFYDVGAPRQNITNIKVNYRRGVEKVIEYLHNMGHRRLGFVGHHAVLEPINERLKAVIEAPSLDVVRALDARTNIGQAVESGAGSDSEPEVHEDYVSAYDLGRFAESARFVRHYPEQNPVLRDLLPTITTPTQVVAGRDDDLVPWSNNQYLADLLPNSEIHPLDAGHFAWEQAAEEYGRLVVDWVSGGHRRAAAG
jgi:pimeloyl-ACP methyl ester carboxylesterase